MGLKTHFSENKLYNILLFLIFTSIFITGIWIKNYFISITILILYIHLIFRNINLLYSILGVLFLFDSTYLANYLGFRWGRTYFIPILLIFIMILLKRINIRTLKVLIKDKYFILSSIIFAWGMLSSLLSIQTILGIKKTISVFLIFILFYLIPRNFFNKYERESFIIYYTIPLNILISTISLLNFLTFLKLLKVNAFIKSWSINASIFENPNTFGVRIMLILMLMNILLITNDWMKDKLNEYKILKIYTIISYLLIIINLVFSSSRTSVLGVAIAFIPLIFILKKQFIVAILPLIYFLWRNKDKLFLFKKLPRGTSGRSKIWEYAIKEVIPKHPIIGVGSGAHRDYMAPFGGKSVHNSYLYEIMNNGFVGFGLWLVVLFLIFKSIFNLDKHKSLFLFSMLGLIAYGFFEIGLFSELSLLMSIFWAFVMLIENNILYENYYEV